MRDPGRDGNRLQIVWIAILASIPMYAVLAWLMIGAPSGFGPGSTETILLAVAGMMFLAAWFLPGVVRQSSSTDAGESASILQWALFESVAIVGFVAAFLGENSAYFLPAGALSLIGLLMSRPVSDGENHGNA